MYRVTGEVPVRLEEASKQSDAEMYWADSKSHRHLEQ